MSFGPRRTAAPFAFVRALAKNAGGETRWLRPKARLGLAAGLAGLALVAVASAGGFSAASAGTARIVGAAADLTKSSASQSSVTTSPAASQYPKPGKGRGDKDHEHERRYQCKVTINDVSKKEGNSGTTPFVCTISLDNTPIDTVTVVWTTANGTATTPSDYLPAAGTTIFAPGVQTQAVPVSVAGDAVKEPNETFYVNLTSVSANAYIGDGQGVGTIANDD